MKALYLREIIIIVHNVSLLGDVCVTCDQDVLIDQSVEAKQHKQC